MIPATTIKDVVAMFKPSQLDAAPQHIKAEDYLGFPMIIADEGEPNKFYTGRERDEVVEENPEKYTKEEREAHDEEYFMAYICHATPAEGRVFYVGLSTVNLTMFSRKKWKRHCEYGNVYSLKYLWEVCAREE